jgi:RNA polymerase sigma-70 factor (ECF subfamily)
LSDPEVMSAVDEAQSATSDDAAIDSAGLGRLVDQLPLKQRQVVTLFYMQEQSHEEVAAMLAMPVGTVKTLLHRARARLSAAVATGAHHDR